MAELVEDRQKERQSGAAVRWTEELRLSHSEAAPTESRCVKGSNKPVDSNHNTDGNLPYEGLNATKHSLPAVIYL